MTVEIIERATRTVRCRCGALLCYTQESVKRGRWLGVPAGWPFVLCPEQGCDRACVVAGVL